MTDFCYQAYHKRSTTGLVWPTEKAVFSSEATQGLFATEAKNRLTYMLAENPEWRNKEIMIALEVRYSQINNTTATDVSEVEMRVFFWMKNATKDYCTRGSVATDLTKITYSPWLKNDGVSHLVNSSGINYYGTVFVSNSLDTQSLKHGGVYNSAFNTLPVGVTPEVYLSSYLKNYYYNISSSTGTDYTKPHNIVVGYIYRPSHVESSTYVNTDTNTAATSTAALGTRSTITVYLVKGDPYVPPVPAPVAVAYQGIYGLEDLTIDVNGGDESTIMARVYNGEDILAVIHQNPNYFLQHGDKLLQYYTFIKTRSYR